MQIKTNTQTINLESNAQKLKLKIKRYAVCRNYELDSCTHGSRPSMNCSFNEFAENSGSVHPPS